MKLITTLVSAHLARGHQQRANLRVLIGFLGVLAGIVALLAQPARGQRAPDAG